MIGRDSSIFRFSRKFCFAEVCAAFFSRMPNLPVVVHFGTEFGENVQNWHFYSIVELGKRNLFNTHSGKWVPARSLQPTTNSHRLFTNGKIYNGGQSVNLIMSSYSLAYFIHNKFLSLIQTENNIVRLQGATIKPYKWPSITPHKWPSITSVTPVFWRAIDLL